MADINKLKDKIKSTIYPNGKGAINASDHQAMLLDMADGMAETDTKLATLSADIEQKKTIVLTIWSNSAVVLNGLPVGEYGWNAYNNKLVIGRGGSYSTLVAKEDTIFNYKGSLFYYENGAMKLCKNQNICISSIGASSSILEGDYVYDSGTIKLKADSYYIPIDGIDSFWYKGNRYNIADIDIELR